MKKLLLALIIFGAISAQAQKNIMLDQSFWQTKPDVNRVKLEIDKGANATQLNQMSFDPVVMAINAEAPVETIKYLLSLPGNEVTKLTHDGRLYLHWAASRGNAEVVEHLISKGSNLKMKDSHGTSPLTFAASGGQQNTRIYDLFLSNGVNLKTELTENGANALLLAIGNDKDLKLTDYFVSKGLDLKSTDAAGHNAFGYAAKSGNISILKALIAKGVPIDNGAILMAGEGSRRGSAPIEVFEYLESLKIKPTAVASDGRNVLHAVVRRAGQNEIVQHFITAGVDVNKADQEGNTVLMNAAVSNRDTALFAILLTKVKNINQANSKGQTALSMAVNSNSSTIVKYLMDRGADVNILDREGNNLAYYLMQSYSIEGARQSAESSSKIEEFEQKIKLLQTRGLNLATAQRNGNTLYHLAVVKGDMILVKRLQDFSIDINAKNKEGVTALHKAAMISKDDSMLKYLLSIGAKKEPKTNFDETAYDLASENESLAKNNISLTFLK